MKCADCGNAIFAEPWVWEEDNGRKLELCEPCFNKRWDADIEEHADEVNGGRGCDL